MTLSSSYLGSRLSAIMPGCATVTLTPYSTGDAAGTAVTTVRGFREPRNTRSFPGAPAFTASADDTVWLLEAATTGGTVPKAGDTITDESSVVWTISDGVTTEQMGGVYRCPCTKQRGTA